MLIDTSVMIDYLRGRTAAGDFMDGLSMRPSISVVSITELYAGARSVAEEDRIARLLSGMRALPVTADIARSAGQLSKHYRASHGVDDFDALIAATAEHHGLALATLNVKHFPMFPRLAAPY